MPPVQEEAIFIYSEKALIKAIKWANRHRREYKVFTEKNRWEMVISLPVWQTMEDVTELLSDAPR